MAIGVHIFLCEEHTYRFFQENGIEVPEEMIKETSRFPSLRELREVISSLGLKIDENILMEGKLLVMNIMLPNTQVLELEIKILDFPQNENFPVSGFGIEVGEIKTIRKILRKLTVFCGNLFLYDEYEGSTIFSKYGELNMK